MVFHVQLSKTKEARLTFALKSRFSGDAIRHIDTVAGWLELPENG
jgi:hypothetical protein